MRHSVLLVDDNQDVRRALRGMFEASGFVCSEAENGQQALSEAAGLKPDLIILDFSMPGMNGLAAAASLKRILPLTAIIMFTMFASETIAADARAAGVSAVFSKDQAARLIPKAESLLMKHKAAI